MEESAKDFVCHFSILQDPRIERNKLHKLESILFLAVCAVLSDAERWVDMEEFREKVTEALTTLLSNQIIGASPRSQGYSLLKT